MRAKGRTLSRLSGKSRRVDRILGWASGQAAILMLLGLVGLALLATALIAKIVGAILT